MTALGADLIGLGLPTALSQYLGEDVRAVTGYGTAQVSRGTALANDSYLILGFNTVTTASGQTAVQILDTMPVGRSLFVNVTSADPALVFPPSGCTIQGQSADTSITVNQNSPVEIFRVSRTAFIGLTAVTGTGGTGTVTSVTFTGDGTVLSSTPSAAVTSSGTLSASLAAQAANRVLAGPTTGAAAAPTFRALVAADLPAGAVVLAGTGLAGTTTFTIDQTPAIISAAGTVQGDATLIAALVNVVTTAPGTDPNFSGVRLPTGSTLFNRRITNHATSGNKIKIYPNSGGTINGLGADVPIQISAGGVSVTLVTADGTAWWVT